MSQTRTDAPSATIELEVLIDSWARHLTAANLSPRTIRNHTDGARAFAAFASARGMPTGASDPRRRPPLLDACKGRSFDDRRDTAIIRVFMNTGTGLSEVAEREGR
jgi:hypothetical protein